MRYYLKVKMINYFFIIFPTEKKKILDSFFFFATLCVKWQRGQNKMPFAVP